MSHPAAIPLNGENRMSRFEKIDTTLIIVNLLLIGCVGSLACGFLGLWWRSQAEEETQAEPTIAPLVEPIAETTESTAGPRQLTDAPGEYHSLQLAFDRSGQLHLVWAEAETAYLYRPIPGETGPIVSTGFERLGGGLRLLQNPVGQVCLFWDGSRAGQSGLWNRCLVDSEWTTIEHVFGLEAVGEWQPAYSPTGWLKVAYSTPDGHIFFEEIGLSEGVCASPEFAIDRTGSYHIAWGLCDGVTYRRSTDEGQSWSEAKRLDTDTAPPGTNLRLLTDPTGQIHLTWNSEGNIYYRRWQAGYGWSSPTEPSQGQSGAWEALAVDSDGLAHLAWAGMDGLLYTRQQPDGSWTEPHFVAETGRWLALAVDAQGQAHLAWHNQHIYYAILPH